MSLGAKAKHRPGCQVVGTLYPLLPPLAPHGLEHVFITAMNPACQSNTPACSHCHSVNTSRTWALSYSSLYLFIPPNKKLDTWMNAQRGSKSVRSILDLLITSFSFPFPTKYIVHITDTLKLSKHKRSIKYGPNLRARPVRTSQPTLSVWCSLFSPTLFPSHPVLHPNDSISSNMSFFFTFSFGNSNFIYTSLSYSTLLRNDFFSHFLSPYLAVLHSG